MLWKYIRKRSQEILPFYNDSAKNRFRELAFREKSLEKNPLEISPDLGLNKFFRLETETFVSRRKALEIIFLVKTFETCRFGFGFGLARTAIRTTSY